MKALTTFILAIGFIGLAGCNTDKIDETSTITIGNYKFTFPEGYSREELQGIDSEVGNINGPDIALFYDYGDYGGPATGLSPSDYEVTEEVIDGYYRQYVKPSDPMQNQTWFHIFHYADTVYPMHTSLTVTVSGITQSQQNIVLSVFENVEVVN